MCKKSEMQFSVFLIHQLAEYWNKTPSCVYDILCKTQILDSYIIPCYETLHTQGSKNLVEDITDFVKEKGIAV